MSEPFLGEVRMISFSFAPRGWALCNGQLLPISQNQALYSLLGTTYGGDGRVNFALPDLRGRTPIHAGTNHTQGEAGGEAAHTLSVGEIPQHTHTMAAANLAPNRDTPAGNYLANSAVNAYSSSSPNTFMGNGMVSATGGSQPHNNLQPFVVLSFIIALQGNFPSFS